MALKAVDEFLVPSGVDTQVLSYTSPGPPDQLVGFLASGTSHTIFRVTLHKVGSTEKFQYRAQTSDFSRDAYIVDKPINLVNGDIVKVYAIQASGFDQKVWVTLLGG